LDRYSITECLSFSGFTQGKQRVLSVNPFTAARCRQMVASFVSGKFRTNSHLLSIDNHECLVIDPGGASEEIMTFVKEKNLTIRGILLTHGHFDHIETVSELMSECDSSVFLHIGDCRLLKHANLYQNLFGGEKEIVIPNVLFVEYTDSILTIGDFNIRWIHTPGHTKGSSCFIVNNVLFTGDTLLKGKIGRTDLPGNNPDDLKKSLSIFLSLEPSFLVFPGHGASTVLKDELYNVRAHLNESKN
jgi:hydroxyacylglutathione hydrolase